MTTAAICATREVSWGPSFYRGEQYDPDLGLYYLRARYYNPATGRFLSRDPLDGQPNDPASLHKYLYADGDAANLVDPTGRGAALEGALLRVMIVAVAGFQVIQRMNPYEVVYAVGAIACFGAKGVEWWDALAQDLHQLVDIDLSLPDGATGALTPVDSACSGAGH
jgi:RHS repeat-associated protein